jgi:hypothetical protein
MRALRLWMGTGFLIASISLVCTAQSGASINGPTLGFVSDEEGRTIWPLLGILGASVPGAPLALPEPILHGKISPRQNYVLAISATGAQPVVIRLDTAELAVVPLAGARSDSEWVAISPTGAAAALYGAESKRLQLVSGLPAAPEIVYEFDASILGNDVRSVSISDDAKVALVNVGDGVRALWIVAGSGAPSPVSAIQPSQMTFIANRHDALIADDATHEVFLLQSLDQNPVRLPGIVLRENERAVSAVAASTDGQTIFLAQEGSADITITDLQSRAMIVVPCPCNPTVLIPMKGLSLFRLNNLSNGPLTLLDVSSYPGTSPRMVIIPIDPDALAGKGQDQ